MSFSLNPVSNVHLFVILGYPNVINQSLVTDINVCVDGSYRHAGSFGTI